MRSRCRAWIRYLRAGALSRAKSRAQDQPHTINRTVLNLDVASTRTPSVTALELQRCRYCCSNSPRRHVSACRVRAAGGLCDGGVVGCSLPCVLCLNKQQGAYEVLRWQPARHLHLPCTHYLRARCLRNPHAPAPPAAAHAPAPRPHARGSCPAPCAAALSRPASQRPGSGAAPIRPPDPASGPERCPVRWGMAARRRGMSRR